MSDYYYLVFFYKWYINTDKQINKCKGYICVKSIIHLFILICMAACVSYKCKYIQKQKNAYIYLHTYYLQYLLHIHKTHINDKSTNLN